ncbi:MAG: hypothetical protein KHX49_06595 [Lachnospiraceae bacterium]|uniref:Uncharacterized protein n=1 Tax=Candidatus Enterocloster excrementigallinarum TaxID=2838558 RepID=A0A9D2PYI5_9FIRM|nr:hypothetical protein [Lachnospiraceae bacterium]HJC67590.1 hypothetical protein [Candidatus Enterocloster excrementigallinarum]
MKQKISKKYIVCLLISIFFMFGFGCIEPFSGLSKTGMAALGIFIGTIFAWLTISVDWPGCISMVAILHRRIGFGGYKSVSGLFRFLFCCKGNICSGRL